MAGENTDAQGFAVDTAKVRAFATFLGTQAGNLDQPLADVGNIVVTPGDPEIIPGAKTLTTAVVDARKGVLDFMSKLRVDLNTLSTNTLKVADMYDTAEAGNKQTADDVGGVLDDDRLK